MFQGQQRVRGRRGLAALALENTTLGLTSGEKVDVTPGAGKVNFKAVLERLNVLRESAYYRRLDETGRQSVEKSVNLDEIPGRSGG